MNNKRREWLEENAERNLETGRRYREKNKERIAAQKRAWRLANLERVDAVKRAWREKNRERERAGCKAWRQKNLEKDLARVRANVKKWRKENPEKHRVQNRLREARKLGSVGQHNADDIVEILRLQKGRCAYCRKALGKDRNIDHIVAVSRGGTNHRSNLQATCKKCNQSKSAKDPIKFAQSRGLLL